MSVLELFGSGHCMNEWSDDIMLCLSSFSSPCFSPC